MPDAHEDHSTRQLLGLLLFAVAIAWGFTTHYYSRTWHWGPEVGDFVGTLLVAGPVFVAGALVLPRRRAPVVLLSAALALALAEGVAGYQELRFTWAVEDELSSGALAEDGRRNEPRWGIAMHGILYHAGGYHGHD